MLYLAVEDIDHTQTKARSLRPTASSALPQDHARRALPHRLRKKIYATIDDLQVDLDLWMREFSEVRPHRGSGASERRFQLSLTPSCSRRNPLAKENAFRP